MLAKTISGQLDCSGPWKRSLQSSETHGLIACHGIGRTILSIRTLAKTIPGTFSKADREAALIQWRLWLPTLERLLRPEESSGWFCCFLRPGSVPAINRFVEGQGGIHLECPETDHLLQAGNASRSENARWRKKQRPDLQPLTLNLNLDKVRGVDGDGGVELEEDRDVGTGEHFMELFHRVALNRGGGNSLHKRLRLYLRKHQSIYSQTLLLAYE
nr:hypothetical protein Iba_chr05dCG12470 [Ipomoea batatas]